MTGWSVTETGERRAAERAQLRTSVEILGGDHGEGAHTANLSATGALLLVQGEVRLGSELRLRFHLPDDPDNPLELWAMAIRAETAGSGTGTRVGVTFIMPPPAAVERIRAVIYESIHAKS